MAVGYFAKHLGALRPADADAEAILRSISMGECVEVTVKRKRNPKHHRKLMALLNIVVENTDGRWPNIDALKEDLKMATGLFEKRVSISGKTYFIPKSISFASMDQAEFTKWYDQALDVIVTRIIPGLDRADLENEVLSMIGNETTLREHAAKRAGAM